MPQDHRSRSGVLDELRKRQCAAWEQGDRLLVEALIGNIGARLSDDEMLELLLSEVMLRTERREDCRLEEYQRRFPQLATSLNRLFAMQGAFNASVSGTAKVIAVNPPLDQNIQLSPEHRKSDVKMRVPPSGTPSSACGLSVGTDAVARVWSASTGVEVTPPIRASDRIWWAKFAPDGTRIITSSAAGTRDFLSGNAPGTVQVWDLFPARVPQRSLQKWIECVTGHQFDDLKGKLASLKSNELEALRIKWRQNNIAFENEAVTNRVKKLTRWHRVEAKRRFDLKEWFAARFHAEQGLKLNPDDQDLSKVLSDTEKTLSHAE